MNAQSFILTVRALDTRTDSVLEEPKLIENPYVQAQGLDQLSNICTLDTLIVASIPLPTPESETSSKVDNAVETVLEQLYAHENVLRSSIDETILRHLEYTSRITTVNDFLFVPLKEQGECTHNWRFVFKHLLKRLEGVRDKSRRIVSRLENVVDTSTVVLRTWQTATKMIEEITETVERELVRHGRLLRLQQKADNGTRSFNRWIIEQLTN